MESKISSIMFAANPFIYFFSIVVLVAAAAYVGYMAIDRLGLPTESHSAIIISKKQYESHEAPYVNIVAGRPLVQSQEIPEVYVLTARVDDLELPIAVSKPSYDSTKIGDRVQIKLQRHRLSEVLQVTDIKQ